MADEDLDDWESRSYQRFGGFFYDVWITAKGRFDPEVRREFAPLKCKIDAMFKETKFSALRKKAQAFTEEEVQRLNSILLDAYRILGRYPFANNYGEAFQQSAAGDNTFGMKGLFELVKKRHPNDVPLILSWALTESCRGKDRKPHMARLLLDLGAATV